MISRRNFFSIVLNMLILMFLFMFITVIKEWKNRYDVNEYVSEKDVQVNQSWISKKIEVQDLVTQKEAYVLFVGDDSSAMAASVEEWCIYTKRHLAVCSDLKVCPQEFLVSPDMVILESEEKAMGDNLERLNQFKDNGCIIIFGELKDANNIQNASELQTFLGIQEIRKKKTVLTGIKLFEGFLLGGEKSYQANGNADEEKRQDLNLEAPWYQVGRGTKTYMVGLLDEGGIENQDLPSLIWRNGADGGKVFAICGDYLQDSTAIGILTGIVAESQEYYLYPVVNARNFSVVNFPSFADENKEILVKKYSRSESRIGTDIILPALGSWTAMSGIKMSCFITPQNDYMDAVEPTGENLEFYLKQLKENNSEAGLSLQYVKCNSIQEKLEKDAQFFSEVSNYKLGAIFCENSQLASWTNLSKSELLRDARTVSIEYTQNYPILSYVAQGLTLQSATGEIGEYAYSDDLRMRSVQSALGYTNAMVNLQKVFWPQKETDDWESIQKRISSNLLDYWKTFSCFDSTTMTESDDKVRTFLNMSYEEEKKDSEITLNVSTDEGSFILRTHGQKVNNVIGAKVQKIEKNAYLLTITEPVVTIELNKQELYYSVK